VWQIDATRTECQIGRLASPHSSVGGVLLIMRSWIHAARGRFARQARLSLGDLKEEHLSRHGFAGPVAMLYHIVGRTRSFGSKAITDLG
jgi:hypothetical protein